MESSCLLTCLVGFSIWTVGHSTTPAGPVTIQSATLDIDEDVNNGRIELIAEIDTAIKNGDLKIAYVLDNVMGQPDVEPGFDFTPSLALPHTFTVTIKEGEMTSNPFIIQLLDDCHSDDPEQLQFTPVEEFAYTTEGDVYSVSDSTVVYTIGESVPDNGMIEIKIVPDNLVLGLVFFEGEGDVKIPIIGYECSEERSLPIDGTCTASLTHLVTSDYDNDDLTIQLSTVIEPDDTYFTITIKDDTDIEEPEAYGIAFKDENCRPDITTHTLDTELHLFMIIDDDEDMFYGIVSPAIIGRKNPRDINVYAITTNINIDTTICGNRAVSPYSKYVPELFTSTDLTCKDSSDVYGIDTLISQPQRESRVRFGSYIINAEYSRPQSIPVFVLPISDVLSPIRGPTITINNGEDVVIGVEFSSLSRELRWKFNGNVLSKYRGRSNFEIKNAQYDKDDGFYEVTRVQRANSGWKTIIRLIIRKCPAGEFIPIGGSKCTNLGNAETCLCYNGGICPSNFPDAASSNDWKCSCPLGFYGQQCQTVYPGNIRIGPPGKAMTCRDLNSDIPRDCKGVLFCYADPLGCQCARGYWGPKCDRGCSYGRYGANCLQRCHCFGSWDSCDPKTGECNAEVCDAAYNGPNCQELL